MRTLCDVCENAAAILFCAADEAALCRACDDKVHLCNKLASRHVRVGLAVPNAVPRCDICENEPDGTSLCLQCDMAVHVGGKRTHGRYLMLRQRVEVCVMILSLPSVLKPCSGRKKERRGPAEKINMGVGPVDLRVVFSFQVTSQAIWRIKMML
ncbi:unnamed protein product [Linum tenue]|uniref:B box-type domain-containing protein n=1 Tax=Linum tenue TaxID=586396 RepID=A0AAV0LVZ3_9ROSI|nr:unnamed protein product [Linum tenue]